MPTHAALAPSGISARAAVRRQLDQELRTDGEINAFCLDYFPATQRLFTLGMDRQQKLNLLLEREDAQQISAQLVASKAAVTTLRAAPGCDPTASAAGSAKALGSALVLLTLAGLVVGGLAPTVKDRARQDLLLRGAESLGAGIVRLAVSTERQELDGDLRPQLADNRSATTSPDEPDVLVTSEPVAVVVEAASGRVLGQTPWRAAATRWETLPAGGTLSVCLRRAGFVSALVELARPVATGAVCPVHIRLQRDIARAMEKAHQQELCNDTPTIL